MNAIEADGLSKIYQGRTVVEDVTFTVAQGSVTGLLGANGAGKSTTLRMLLDLTRATTGRVTFGGRPYSSLPNPGRVVGSMLDAQANHRGRTGREIIRLQALMLGIKGYDAGQALDRVGLAGAANKQFGRYSLGMKQRLGLACAVVGRPSVLILDEPANGLDPQGILWIRDFLRDFADDGGTVLLSSHLLREVELLADAVLVIVEGRKVADMTRAEIATLNVVRVVAQDMATMRSALIDAELAHEETSDGAFEVHASADEVGLLAARSGIALRELGVGRQGALESLFFSVSERGGGHEQLVG